MDRAQIVDWLLDGDVSVQYQTYRDLIGVERPDLQARIATEGWGLGFLNARNLGGGWGEKFYQPKWVSSHYTLLDLRNIEIASDTQIIREELSRILAREKSLVDGGILPIGEHGKCDVCVNGMFLHYACFFKVPEAELQTVIDFVLQEHMSDGGFNCRSNRAKPHHSSLHTTCSVLEGLLSYLNAGYTYRAVEVRQAIAKAEEFMLLHQLFISDHTGEVIDKRFTQLSYPYRWRYSVLRALDYLRAAKRPWDDRLQPAIDLLKQKRRKDKRWNSQAKHPGKTHFDMERAGRPSRWVTLFAMRVFDHFGVE